MKNFPIGNPIRASHERGGILVIAIIVILAMLIMAIPFLFKLSAGWRSTERGYRALAAFNLAEEGIDRALWEMNQPYVIINGLVSLDAEGNGLLAATNETVGDKTGTFQGTITTNLGVEPNTRTIVSTGAMPTVGDKMVDRTVVAVLEKYFKSIWDFAFFGDEGVYGRNNWKPIDSYDSRRPGYVGDQGNVGTNATGEDAIYIGPASEIHGDVAAGFGTELDQIDEVINVDDDLLKDGGEKMILSAPFELPPVDIYNLTPELRFRTPYNDYKTWFITPPSVEGPLLSSQVDSNYLNGALTDTNLTPEDSGIYTNFYSKNQDITVTGHVSVYITGLDNATASFYGKNSLITINPNSSLTIILGKTTWDVDNNYDFNNNTLKAENLVFLGTEQFTGNFDFRNNDEICAAVYMPHATFYNRNNITMWGSVICDRIDIRNNINFHYDEALGDLTAIKGGIPYWRIKTWQEKVGD